MRFNLIENPIMRALGRLCDFMILNVLFIICSIPIFTIGASITAMYTVMLKLVKNEEGYIFKGFLLAFKENFKKSTILWLMYAPLGLIILLNIHLTQFMDVEILQTVLMVIFVMMGAILVFMGLYLFPMTARYENTIKVNIKNALLLSIGKLPYTILLLIIHAAAIVITLLTLETIIIGTIIWIFVGFALVAWLSAKVLRKVFEVIDPKEEEEKSPMDEV
ncbi:MAG: DUF624 domain-containing protein [Lachnospiraceae bacterium]|nr:DUF624 domain-containing protein [Lachnospiraceae bacterium]